MSNIRQYILILAVLAWSPWGSANYSETAKDRDMDLARDLIRSAEVLPFSYMFEPYHEMEEDFEALAEDDVSECQSETCIVISYRIGKNRPLTLTAQEIEELKAYQSFREKDESGSLGPGKIKPAHENKITSPITRSLHEEFFERDYHVYEIKLLEKDPRSKGDYQVRVFHAQYTDTILVQLLQFKGWNIRRPVTSVTGIEVGKYIYETEDKSTAILAKIGTNVHSEWSFQNGFDSVMAGVELQYTFKVFGVRMRVTGTEGLSYASHVPHFEGLNVRVKERNGSTDNLDNGRDSRLMNFLGFTLGANAHDISGIESLENCFLELYAWHRSGVFGAVSLYNNVHGGSNFIGGAVSCRTN